MSGVDFLNEFLFFFSGVTDCSNRLHRCLATDHGVFSCTGESALTPNRAPGSAVVIVVVVTGSVIFFSF